MPGKNGRPLVFGPGPFTIVDHVSGDSWQLSTISIVRIMRSLDLYMVRNHIYILLYNLQFWDFFVKLLSIDSSESGLLSISAKDLTFAPNLNQERRVFQIHTDWKMNLVVQYFCKSGRANAAVIRNVGNSTCHIGLWCSKIFTPR